MENKPELKITVTDNLTPGLEKVKKKLERIKKGFEELEAITKFLDEEEYESKLDACLDAIHKPLIDKGYSIDLRHAKNELKDFIRWEIAMILSERRKN